MAYVSSKLVESGWGKDRAMVRGTEEFKASPGDKGGLRVARSPVCCVHFFPSAGAAGIGIFSSIQERKPPGYIKTGCILKQAFQNKMFLCCSNSS